MTPRRALPAAAAALVALLGACGGGGEPGPYALEPTRVCLEDQNLRVTLTNLDFVASTALGGALRARTAGNFVTIAFGEDRSEAARISRAYVRFAGRRIPIKDVLVRIRNVVLVWNAPPSPEDSDRIRNCLETE